MEGDEPATAPVVDAILNARDTEQAATQVVAYEQDEIKVKLESLEAEVERLKAEVAERAYVSHSHEEYALAGHEHEAQPVVVTVVEPEPEPEPEAEPEVPPVVEEEKTTIQHRQEPSTRKARRKAGWLW